MKLSISNIAWSKEHDQELYNIISQKGFEGIEIAPTRIFEEKPYEHIEEAKQFAKELYEKYNLKISSMQSIWFGKQEKIFRTLEERKVLLKYTKKAIDFADAIDCKNLVFGCPKNRVVFNLEKDYQTAIDFFKEIGEYANGKNTCIAIEPNPTIYNTNFITKTQEAIKIVKEINSDGIKVNLDLGTMIENKEDISILKNNIGLINHVHISEPNLEIIKTRELHRELIKLLKEEKYNKYVSIEMKNGNNVEDIENVLNYIYQLGKES